MSVPVYQDAIATELAYVLNHAETSVVVAEDQEQVDKVLSLRASFPNLKLVVYDDPRGLLNYDDPILKSFEAVKQQGREFGAAHAGYVDDAVDAGKPDDIALFSYTSGTTSRPKGVMLTHANLLLPAAAFAKAEQLKPTEEHLAYLPMAWIGTSLVSIALHLHIGFTCNFPEKPERLIDRCCQDASRVVRRRNAGAGPRVYPAANRRSDPVRLIRGRRDRAESSTTGHRRARARALRSFWCSSF